MMNTISILCNSKDKQVYFETLQAYLAQTGFGNKTKFYLMSRAHHLINDHKPIQLSDDEDDEETPNNVLVPTPLHNSTSVVNVSERDLFASRRRRLKPEPRLDEEHEVVTIYHPTTSGVKPRLFTSKPLRAFYKSLIGQELSSKVRDILT